jgi:hypothetical protein
MKCKRPGCIYLRDPEIKNNGGLYCCKSCKLEGTHGRNCKKTALKAQTQIISDVSVYSWGKGQFGYYLIFNFKTNNNTPISFINYKITKGKIPPYTFIIGRLAYLFNNSNIIFTNQNILDSDIVLSIQTQQNGTFYSSSKQFLSSSPYINCNYFDRHRS